MKISQVLEAYNKVVDNFREAEGIEANGHFVLLEDIKKAMGSYKQFTVTILYHNMDKNVNYPFVGAQLIEKCPSGKEEEAMCKCELRALVNFFAYCRSEKVFDSVLNNTYERVK